MMKLRNDKIISGSENRNSEPETRIVLSKDISNFKFQTLPAGCYAIILLIITMFRVQQASASSVWDKKSIISPPIGTEILPGGSLGAENIKEHAIFSKVIPFAISYTIRIAIALSVVALIFGGYQYITAYGKAEKHGAAQKTITYAIIGLVVSLTAYAIVAIVTSIQLS
jgi:hypothetical protein